MPNWVFNTLDNYPKELYNKYKSDDGERDIDFNKIIPEPEEITNTPSGSFNNVSKAIYQYKEYYKDLNSAQKTYMQYDHDNPLKDMVKDTAYDTITSMGELAIENPDESLHEILDKDDNKFAKNKYEKYVNIFGNNAYSTCKDFPKIYENYIKEEEKSFEEYKERDKNSKYSDKACQQYDNLESMGKQLVELKEKYGFDNWYDWRTANWGTKWNACDTNYDKDSESLRFDTAWSIPYPILTKMAKDNPNSEINGYSEEETGWFEEYDLKDGVVKINARGENVYDEEKDETHEERENLNPPEILTYDEFIETSRKEWSSFVDGFGKRF